MSAWQVLTISGDNLEEQAALLYEAVGEELQLCGTIFNEGGTCSCYFQGTLSEEIKNQIAELNLEVLDCQEVKNENWTQSCPELLEVIDFDKISIKPVIDIAQASQIEVDPQRDVLIIPGTGFGTGHHASTKNLIRMLHRPEIAELNPQTVLDAGSGSGILALVCTKLYKSSVDAYENDAMACENATDNVGINNMQDKITIYNKSAHLSEGSYDLIIANLYAELLDTLCFHLVSLAKPKSIFLLSGIRADLAESIREKYVSRGLTAIAEKIEDGWASMILRSI